MSNDKEKTNNEIIKELIGKKVKLVAPHPHAGKIGTIVSFDYLTLLGSTRPKIKFDDEFLDGSTDSCYVTEPKQMIIIGNNIESQFVIKDNYIDPVKQAIDNFFKYNTYSSNLQNLQPLEQLKTHKKYYKKPNNKKMIPIFYECRGIKSNIARKLCCSRPALNKWIEEDIELKEAYEDSIEYSIDHTESKMHELIDGVIIQDYDFKGKPVVYQKEPNQKMISYFLSTKAKHRGYTTSIETKVSGKLQVEPIAFHYHAPDEPEPINDSDEC